MNGSSLLIYLKSGKLLHLITLVELVVGFFMIRWLWQYQTGSWMLEGLRIYGLVYFFTLPVFAQLDARSRYQNYKQIRDQFILYGFDRRILKPIIKSRCQRDAAQLAADDTGHGCECRNLFHKAGYRWYHLFPDFVFTHPYFLLTKAFWRTTFFCPAYRSKLNPGETQLLHLNNLSFTELTTNG